MENLVLLKKGDSGEDVRRAQKLLKKQGWFFDGDPRGNFGPLTEEAVIDFQHAHLDADGEWLGVDGEIGDKTWWALMNPSGDAQRSLVDASLPGGLPEDRARQLEVALNYWSEGVHEVPDGSNQGDGVDQFIKGYGPVPWCMLFVSHCDAEANEGWALGRREAGTHRAWKKATELGIYFPKEEVEPEPGDWFLMQYRRADGSFKGKGHVGFILRVSKDGLTFQTIEANAGNRVAVKTRRVSQGTLIGYVKRFGSAGDYERGLCPRMSESVSGTR